MEAGSGSGGGQGDWLPPEPPGPRPDLGQPPPQQPPPPPPPPPAGGWQRAPGQWQQPQWQGQWQQGWAPPGYGPVDPGNGPAVAAFTLAISGIGLLVISFGVAFILALPCAICAIVYGVKGKRRVDRGDTRKHRGFAQAGFIIGIVGVVLSLLAAAVWIALFADEDFRDDFEEDLEDDEGFETTRALRTALLAARVAAAAGRLLTG